MSNFEDVVHHLAKVGEHVVEFIDGQQAIKINGATVTAEELVQLVSTLSEAASRLGLSL